MRFAFAFLLFTLVTACGSELQQLEGGVELLVLDDGSGSLPQDGQYLRLHYDLGLDDGVRIDRSRDRDAPFLMRLVDDGTCIPGLRTAVRHVPIGGRARARIPADQAYGSMGKGVAIPPDRGLVIEFEVLDAFEVTDSGAQVLILEPGEGSPPQPGDALVLTSRTFVLESGRDLVATPERGPPESLVLGSGAAFPVYEEALQRLAPGGRCLLVVPPHLGYGEEGLLPNIPPKTDVLFELHLRGIRHLP